MEPPSPSRRSFLKTSASALGAIPFVGNPLFPNHLNSMNPLDFEPNMIGAYGPWAASLLNDPPELSFRQEKFEDISAWKAQVRPQLDLLIGAPSIGNNPKVTINKSYEYDGLEIEELSWDLGYGNPTKALLLKPKGVQGKLPGILALHDHGGNKYFGKRKITQTSKHPHPLIVEHQKQYYEGRAWANEVAKRGYVVLIPDTFTFGSRRVLYKDIAGYDYGFLKVDDKSDKNPENPENIAIYNQWASDHEHVMSKSLFCAGTTWPGVFLREDQRALDVLCAREDVDSSRVGCAGLSGGGLRTAYLGGLDERIACAVCVGFMTTWKDLILHKSYTHTWMTYIPILPNYLDFPEIMGLRVPLPMMVQNNEQDQLFTPEEMRRSDEILGNIFKKAGAKDQYQGKFYPGLHKFDKQMQSDAFEWFDRWLTQK